MRYEQARSTARLDGLATPKTRHDKPPTLPLDHQDFAGMRLSVNLSLDPNAATLATTLTSARGGNSSTRRSSALGGGASSHMLDLPPGSPGTAMFGADSRDHRFVIALSPTPDASRPRTSGS